MDILMILLLAASFLSIRLLIAWCDKIVSAKEE